jgi:carbon monoxide dehydrogenase subunit G
LYLHGELKRTTLKYQDQTDIHAPVSAVYAYLNDVTRRTEFIPMLEQVQLLDEPPITVGTRYVEVAAVAGQNLKTTYQIVALEPEKRMRVKTIQSVFPIEAELTLTALEEGTRLGITLDFQLTGFYRFAAPFIGGIIQQQSKAILANLKSILEE